MSTLGKTIVVGAGIALTAAVVIAVLSYEKFMQWFQQRQGLVQSDKDLINVSFIKRYHNGNYRTVQGVFDTGTSEYVDTQTTESHSLDSRIANAHNQEGIAIWT
ncbi:hypothetical protein [Crocosphaera watsonii]|uniref:Uncharacterized protein n=1 Tax=Crocosphaera watsonii WH 0003 TaxID=423471 RepID=G5IZH9_CROWT|nr:hypothetical protein [Crocosphaera watsonii]EHJ14653.1 hypothetical protein CWATWH0003_0670 [Crocosphaera watsonii WH 0003]